MTVADPLIEALTGKQPYYVVLKRCTLGGQPRERGEVIDTAGWRSDRLAMLAARRMVFQLPYGLKPPAAQKCDDGYERMMLPADAIDAKAAARRKPAKKPTKKTPAKG